VAAGRAHDYDDDVFAPWDGAEAAGHASIVVARGAFGSCVGLTHEGSVRTEDVSDPLFDAIRDNPYSGDHTSHNASQDDINPREFSRARVATLADARTLSKL
jgi:hypothetical protein